MLSSCDSSMSLYLLMKIPGENCVWHGEIALIMSVQDERKREGEKLTRENLYTACLWYYLQKEAVKDETVKFGD